MSNTDTSWSGRPFRLDGFIVDPAARTLTGPHGAVQLEPKVMDVLVVLAENAGRVVPRDEILTRVWPRSVAGDEVLFRSIYQLRKHFGEDSRTARYIVTVPKRGYRLAVLPAPYRSTPAHASGVDPRRLLWPLAAGAAGALAASALLAFLCASVDRGTGASSRAPSPTDETALRKTSDGHQAGWAGAR